MCKKECKGDKCALGLIYPNTNANIACDEDCYFKSDELNNKEKYIKQHPKEMKKCGF